MTRYRVTIASAQVYVIDTDAMVFWPEGYEDKRGDLRPFPRMNPEDVQFVGKVLDVSEESK